jgi:hypothetical protein
MLTTVDMEEALRAIAELLKTREEDFESLRQMQLEWLQFQTTLDRLIHLVDGNGRPPISERLLLLEESSRRVDVMSSQMHDMKLRVIGLLVGVVVSLFAALVSCVT